MSNHALATKVTSWHGAIPLHVETPRPTQVEAAGTSRRSASDLPSRSPSDLPPQSISAPSTHESPALPVHETPATAATQKTGARETDTHLLTLRRAWPRSPHHALVEYATESGDVVAGQWFAHIDHAADVAAHTPGAYLACDAPFIVIQPAGADKVLTPLPELAAAGDLLVHRPERRAVVRQSQPRTSPSYVKLVKPSRVLSLINTHEQLSAAVGADCTTPKLLSADRAVGVTVWSHVPGITLFDGMRTQLWDAAHLGEIWRVFGKTLAHLHRADVSDIRTVLPLHSPEREIAVAQNWLNLAAALLDETAPHVHIVDHATDVLTTGTPTRPAIIHRDLHDKQVLVNNGRLGMVDADTLSLGEPELDLANLRTHLELRHMQGFIDADTARLAWAAFRDGYGEQPRMSRVNAFATLTRLRLFGVYAFRPRWRSLVTAWVRDRLTSPEGLLH